jgi:hypothetical protein
LRSFLTFLSVYTGAVILFTSWGPFISVIYCFTILFPTCPFDIQKVQKKTDFISCP